MTALPLHPNVHELARRRAAALRIAAIAAAWQTLARLLRTAAQRNLNPENQSCHS